MKIRNLTVLVIEDDDAIRSTLALILEDAGYEVHTAHEGAEGLVSLSASRPDVILVDLLMPIMDGWAFRRRQLDLNGLAEIPTIVMTSGPRPTSTELGSAHFLAKPFSHRELLSAVDAVQE